MPLRAPPEIRNLHFVLRQKFRISDPPSGRDPPFPIRTPPEI